jgi:hypothetical protein
MTPEELDRALDRVLGNVFLVSGPIVDTFKRVFTDYPIEKLETIEDDRMLERIAKRISSRRDVREMREWIDFERQHGEQTLDTVILGIFVNNLPSAVKIPRDQTTNLNGYSTQEVWAYSQLTNDKIAMGQFPLDVGLDKVIFTPSSVFYGENLKWINDPGEEPQLFVDGGIYVRKAARAVAFRDIPGRSKARAKVRGALKNAYSDLPKNVNNLTYHGYESGLINLLSQFFPSVIDKNLKPDYLELYNLFEQVKRRNFRLEQYVKDGVLIPFIGALTRAIESTIPSPYAVIRTRVKEVKRDYEKIIEALYNVESPDRQGKDSQRRFEDLYGIRIILPTEDDVIKYVKMLRRNRSLSIRDEKNYVSRPKRNQYRAYHFIMEFSGVAYDVQIRTHEWDYLAHKGGKQDEDTVLQEKRRRIEAHTPRSVRMVVRAMMDLN